MRTQRSGAKGPELSVIGFGAWEAGGDDWGPNRSESEVIDPYQLPWPDPTGVPVEDTWGAMGGLVDSGKVRWIGVSNFDRALIDRCRADRHVDSLQQEFSLVRLDDRELIRWCGEVGVG